MKLKNNEIFILANELMANMKNFEGYIPAKANFFIQRNINTLATAAREIEEARMGILKHYGAANEETRQFDIPVEERAAAEQELVELFNIEQDLDIKTISIDSLGDTNFTTEQMQAIMFMIEE